MRHSVKFCLFFLIGCCWLFGDLTLSSIQAASSFEIEEYQNQSDQDFLSSTVQIEIFAKNDDYFSQRMTDLFIPQLNALEGQDVAVRMYEVADPTIYQYLQNLLTFFDPITPDFLDNPVIIMNNNKIITGYTDLNNDQLVSLIERLINEEEYVLPPGVGVYELKSIDYEPNMYFSLQTSQVEPKRPNEVWYEQLPMFVFLDIEEFPKVSDVTWQQASSWIEVFIDETCKDCSVLLNQSLLDLVPLLEESGGAIRVYNLNHPNVRQYLTEFSTYFDYTVQDTSQPIVIVNRRVLIEGYNLKRPKTYQETVMKLLNHESDLPFLDGITLYPVSEERYADAQTIYYSEGLSKLAHQIGQELIDISKEEPVMLNQDLSSTISNLPLNKIKLIVMVMGCLLLFISAEVYIRQKKKKIISLKNINTEE